MSDPLSITGSAVGVISLGFSICSVIIRYTRNAQGQSDDMQYLATKASNIRSQLKALCELIEEMETDLSDVADNLESKAVSLQVYLDRLKGPIERYERARAAATGVRSRARRTWETAIYHFKKEELFELRDCLQSMEMDLNTTLNLYSAREFHKFGLKQDIFGLKQDRLIEKMETLQLSITATPHQTLLQKSTAHSISCHGNFNAQSYGPPVAYTWKNVEANRGRRQYRFYNKWLSRAFTAAFSLSSEPSIFPIVSLHCNAVVGPESWMGRMHYGKVFFHKGFTWKQAGCNFLKEVDDWIQLLQSAVSEKRVRPTDELCIKFRPDFRSPIYLSLLDLPFSCSSLWGTLHPDNFPGICKYIKFMLHHNVTTNYRSPYSLLRGLCKSFVWAEEVQHLASYIIERCGPIDWAPQVWVEKKNMQSLLRRYEDSVDLPLKFMATLRESEKDLRDLLKSGISPSEESFNEVTLLQLAMGWPTGVKLLRQTHPRTFLPHSYHSGHLSYLSITDEDDQINRYIQSCRNLIEDGFTIQIGAIVDGSSNKVTRLLIHELAKRRRNLLDIAEAHIHYSVLSDLRNGETGIPDASAPAICDALTAKGHKIDQTLTAFQRRSIFCWKQHPDNLNTIYEAGFTDVDLPSTEGFTALMFQCMPYFDDHSCMTVAWMISKGADPFRKLPGLETTVLHWINAGLGQRFQIEANEIQRGNRAASYFDPYAAICHLHQIDRHLFSLSIKDACLCSCSLDGCSPLSVALRDTVHHLYLGDQQISQDAHRFRQFLEFLLHHNQSKIEVCHTLIRSLTFDGLGLSHTCCTELRHYEPWDCIRHESDLQEIREEQKLSLGRFENLVSEFVSQFDALGLSLMDFLQNAWYERMVRFISERDKYDHEHHEKIRELGINCWETDEIEIPLVVQLICDQARVVESDSEDS